MNAYYYAIIEKSTNEKVDEGIIRNSEDTIYPRQNTGIEELPFECEAHHFKSTNYDFVGWYFEINIHNLIKYKTS